MRSRRRSNTGIPVSFGSGLGREAIQQPTNAPIPAPTTKPNGVFLRNLLDDLRLALELLLKTLLASQKSLENQIPQLGAFIKQKGGSSELANMFVKLIDYYTKYQNSYVKHDDAVIEEEVEFIFELTRAIGRRRHGSDGRQDHAYIRWMRFLPKSFQPCFYVPPLAVEWSSFMKHLVRLSYK